MTDRKIGTFGRKPATVSVYRDERRVACFWYVGAHRKAKFWPASAKGERDAIRWAKAYADERERMDAPKGDAPHLTLAGLWEKYRALNEDDWRVKTAKGYGQYADVLARVLGPNLKVRDLGLAVVDDFKVRQRAAGIAHSQVRRQIGFLRQMLNWAEGRDLVHRNRLRAYRYVIPKDERSAPPAEYARSDMERIAGELGWPSQWRVRGVVTLCGTLGARINAVLHLKWDDVDLDAGTVTWRAEFDKMGEERTQPLTPRARATLVEAHGQRHETEPWVFYSGRADRRKRGAPMHYNAVHEALKLAEQRAGVEHLPGRAFHGLRRMVVGDMGDLRLAGAWVGQKSLKITAGYDRERAGQVEEARDRMTKAEGL